MLLGDGDEESGDCAACQDHKPSSSHAVRAEIGVGFVDFNGPTAECGEQIAVTLEIVRYAEYLLRGDALNIVRGLSYSDDRIIGA